MKHKYLIAILVALIFLAGCAAPPAEIEAEPVEEVEEVPEKEVEEAEEEVEEEVPEEVEEEPEEAVEEDIVKIGFIAPLVGDTANYGEASRTGVELAQEETPEVDGKKVKVIFENGGCNAKAATNAANKLINIDKVKVIIGTVCSSETLAVAPIAEENKVVLVSTASSSPDITTAGDYIFRTWPSDAFQGPTMAEHVYTTEGLKTVAVMHTNSDYNLGLANAFKKAYEDLGGEVLITETNEQDAKDFRTQLTKIRAKNPEAMYIVHYGEAGIVLKQIGELGIDAKIFASETIATQDILDDAGYSAEGVIYATPKFDEEVGETKTFLEKYMDKFGKESPWDVISANSYDNYNLVVAAIAEKGYDADGIKEYLYNVKDYNGAGGMLTIDENGDAVKSFQLMKIENGEFVKLE